MIGKITWLLHLGDALTNYAYRALLAGATIDTIRDVIRESWREIASNMHDDTIRDVIIDDAILAAKKRFKNDAKNN
jgi:hypothetical protein